MRRNCDKLHILIRYLCAVASIFVLNTCLLPSALGEKEKAFLMDYDGSVVIPADLCSSYARFAEAFRSGNEAEVRKSCLPRGVEITTASLPRDKSHAWISIPFGIHHFDPMIMSASAYDTGEMCLRTRTSSLWFVETEAEGWMLYAYKHHPVE